MQAFDYTHKYPHLGARLRDFTEVREQITDSFLSRIMEGTLSDWEALEKPRPHRFILVVGGPGVGKGTQCAKAAAKPGIAHVSVGELLRQEQMKPLSAFGDFISQSIAAKVPVPSILAIKLLNRELSRLLGKQVILLDGFPRSEEQLNAFEQQVQTAPISQRIFLIGLDHKGILSYYYGLYRGEPDPTSDRPRGVIRTG